MQAKGDGIHHSHKPVLVVMHSYHTDLRCAKLAQSETQIKKKNIYNFI